MVTGEPVVPGAAALSDAGAFIRVDAAGDGAPVAALVAGAIELCEAFTGQTLLRRGFVERLVASGAWTRLARTPVTEITGVSASGAALLAADFAVDIGADGDGWVRLPGGGPRFAAGPEGSPGRRIEVAYRAGIADAWGDLPAALRHGVLRLAAHGYAERGAEVRGSEPPAAVTALWRPYRRMRLR